MFKLNFQKEFKVTLENKSGDFANYKMDIWIVITILYLNAFVSAQKILSAPKPIPSVVVPSPIVGDAPAMKTYRAAVYEHKVIPPHPWAIHRHMAVSQMMANLRIYDHQASVASKKVLVVFSIIYD